MTMQGLPEWMNPPEGPAPLTRSCLVDRLENIGLTVYEWLDETNQNFLVIDGTMLRGRICYLPVPVDTSCDHAWLFEDFLTTLGNSLQALGVYGTA